MRQEDSNGGGVDEEATSGQEGSSGKHCGGAGDRSRGQDSVRQ